MAVVATYLISRENTDDKGLYTAFCNALADRQIRTIRKFDSDRDVNYFICVYLGDMR